MRVCMIVLGLFAACGQEEPASEPARSLTGGEEKGAILESRFDPPTDIPHLEETLSALREMDGYLTRHSKPVLYPGSNRRHIAHICRLHYERWVTVLKDRAAMPGPYEPR